MRILKLFKRVRLAVASTIRALLYQPRRAAPDSNAEQDQHSSRRIQKRRQYPASGIQYRSPLSIPILQQFQPQSPTTSALPSIEHPVSQQHRRYLSRHLCHANPPLAYLCPRCARQLIRALYQLLRSGNQPQTESALEDRLGPLFFIFLLTAGSESLSFSPNLAMACARIRCMADGIVSVTV